jgi:hypothetical protein
MVASATTQAASAQSLRVSRDIFRKVAGPGKSRCKRAFLRTLALIQLCVIGESCAPQFRNACQEYEVQGGV